MTTLFVQFIGFVFFLFISLSGFWCLTFLIGFAHYWAIVSPSEFYGKKAGLDYKENRRKILPFQEGVSLIWKKQN